MTELVAVAILVVVVLVAWAAVRHRGAGRQRRLVDGLRDDDPDRRLAALDVVARDGVAPHAGTLVAHVVRERDPRVLARLRELVRQSQWEPVDSEALVALRQWASSEPDVPVPVPATAPTVPGIGGFADRLAAALGGPLRRLVLHEAGLVVRIENDSPPPGDATARTPASDVVQPGSPGTIEPWWWKVERSGDG